MTFISLATSSQPVEKCQIDSMTKFTETVQALLLQEDVTQLLDTSLELLQKEPL